MNAAPIKKVNRSNELALPELFSVAVLVSSMSPPDALIEIYVEYYPSS